MTSPLIGISDFWLVETGWLCRHSPIAHSSADLGVVLRISFAAGPISPLRNSVRGKNRKNSRLSHLSYFFLVQALARPFVVIVIPCWFLGFGCRRGSRRLTWFFWGGSLRSLFIHFIGWVPLLEQKHGSTNLQNRWKRGSRRGTASRRCSRCSKDERTGSFVGFLLLKRMIQILIAHAEFCLNLAMCCVNGVLNVPCSASPRSPALRESGHM